MSRKSRIPRIPKSPQQRLNECETHLYFLGDAVRQYADELERFKQIAAELRVLVCERRTKRRLLLDLMDEYGFSYEIMPPGSDPNGPPAKLCPVPMVGWRVDPVRKKLSEALSAAIRSGDRHGLERIKKEMAALAVPVPFRDWANRGSAVYIHPYDYGNCELVLAIAQQFGSSHEDDSVNEPIVQLQQFVIGADRGDLVSLIAFARVVIKVGRLFVQHLVAEHRYDPIYFKVEAV